MFFLVLVYVCNIDQFEFSDAIIRSLLFYSIIDKPVILLVNINYTGSSHYKVFQDNTDGQVVFMVNGLSVKLTVVFFVSVTNISKILHSHRRCHVKLSTQYQPCIGYCF